MYILDARRLQERAHVGGDVQRRQCRQLYALRAELVQQPLASCRQTRAHDARGKRHATETRSRGHTHASTPRRSRTLCGPHLPVEHIAKCAVLLASQTTERADGDIVLGLPALTMLGPLGRGPAREIKGTEVRGRGRGVRAADFSVATPKCRRVERVVAEPHRMFRLKATPLNLLAAAA